ncbi:MAG TPA: PEP-CTERM sorting domain-containing protein [Gemmataceae bacterium]|jgi:hypothetical protein|nr:PEP-CTERM sorting domain-containing protein [Gemmataceae bacterium]
MPYAAVSHRRGWPGGFVFAAALSTALAPVASGQTLSKGNQILISQGLQVQGMVTNYDPFHLSTYQAANYSSVNWVWDSNTPAQGPAPGTIPWSRWVRDHYTTDKNPEMPPIGAEAGYMSKLISLSLGDEPNLNDDATRTYYVNWFNSVRAAFPNTILYTNNYGGQVTDAALGDFITRAKPDMISFDTYPFQPGAGPAGGSPTNWYGDLRRYRVYAADANIPLAIYRQTFHDASDRDPSESEMRLNTFAALAFNVKYLTDFTYNSGASSLFNNAAGGDNSPNSLYTSLATVNKQARNFGPALTRLQPISVHPDGSQPTTDIMFIRGNHFDSASNSYVPNALPIGFTPDPQAPNSYSDWVFQRNDPYLNGWTVTNNGAKNGGQKGDAIVSWFKPLDESFDGPNYTNEAYMMVVNGLTDPTGTAADTRQHITLDFLFGSAAGHLTGLDVLNPDTGAVDTVQLTPIGGGKYRWAFDLDGGSAELFKFADGAPFVGVAPVPEPGTLGTLGAVATLFVWRRWRRATPAR